MIQQYTLRLRRKYVSEIKTYQKPRKNRIRSRATGLLHSRFKCRHATLLPTKWAGVLRDDTKNGCVAD